MTSNNVHSQSSAAPSSLGAVRSSVTATSSAATKEYLHFAEKAMVAGGLAGCLGKTLTAPLSRLTVLYQIAPLLNKQPTAAYAHLHTNDSILATLRNIIRQEGWRSLWKGNGTAVLHRFPYSATNFATFAMINEQLQLLFPQLDPSMGRLLAGAAAGAVSCAVCYPLDIVRTRLTVGVRSTTSSSGDPVASGSSRSTISSVLRDLVEREGVRGLFSGLKASQAVAVPTYALSFGVYGAVKEQLLRQGGAFAQSKSQLSVAGSLLAGSVTGVASSLLMFPMDVVRKRCQMAGLLSPGQPHSTSLLEMMMRIRREEGLRGLYRGLGVEVLKVVPMVAVTFCTYEVLRDLFDRLFPDHHSDHQHPRNSSKSSGGREAQRNCTPCSNFKSSDQSSSGSGKGGAICHNGSGAGGLDIDLAPVTATTCVSVRSDRR